MKVKEAKFTFEANLTGVNKKEEKEYYTIETLNNNSFIIHNLKSCPFGKLIVTCSCENPEIENSPDGNSIISQSYELELGGFY